MLYPVYPRPELTLDRIACMLRILHMYDFHSFLQECLAFLSKNLPKNLSPNPASPCFVLTWLKLADDLQLSELQALCMHKIREFAYGKVIEKAFLVPCSRHAPVRVPRVSKPSTCPNGHNAHGQYGYGGQATYCPSWCNSCEAWVCCYNTSSVTKCKACGQRVQHTEIPLEEVRWFIDDVPELADGIKSLSRQAMEELLASVIASTSGSFSTVLRPQSKSESTLK